jgi:exonuclease III
MRSSLKLNNFDETLNQNRLQYPEFCELIEKNDIVCLQETKTDDIDKIDLEGYTFKMKNRKKIGRKSDYLLHYYYYYMSWNYVVRTDHQ